METFKLLNGPTLEFYTVAEKKPSDWDSVVYIVNYPPSPIHAIHRGYYKSFKTTPGRFVSKAHGSHQEKYITHWANALSVKT